MTHQSTTRLRMFARILLRSAGMRPGRTITAMLAVVIAAAIATAMATLYLDVQAKLHGDFQSYGANILITAPPAAALPSSALDRVESLLGSSDTAAPFAFAVARSRDGTPIVVAGTDMDRARQLNRWWAVTKWPEQPGTALLGVRVPKNVADDAKNLELTYGSDRAAQFKVVGTLRTGSDADSRIYLKLADFTSWTGVRPSVIEVAVAGSAPELNALMKKISAAIPEASVQPVRQIVEAEGRVFEKTRSMLFLSVLIIALTSLLCMLATLTSSLLDRRKDFALMKALGASQLTTDGIFGLEAACLGFAGGMIGYGGGLLLAQAISSASFHNSISPRWIVLPQVLLGCLAVSLIAALLSLTWLRQIPPAAMLKGE